MWHKRGHIGVIKGTKRGTKGDKMWHKRGQNAERGDEMCAYKISSRNSHFYLKKSSFLTKNKLFFIINKSKFIKKGTKCG